MDNYNDILSSLFPLCPTEELCKQFLLEHPEKQIMDAEELQVFFRNTINLTNEAVGSVLTENSLIPEGYNVMALKHLRYLPGCFHSHDFFEVNCVLSGACIYQTPYKSTMICSGDVVIFPPHNVHTIGICQDDCILINIMIRASTFDRYFFSLFNSFDVLVDFWTQALYGKQDCAYLLCHCRNDTEIAEYILRMYQESLTANKYQSQRLDAFLHIFLITLLQRYEQDMIISNPEKQQDDRNILRIINYIGREYQTLTLAKLAETFHYSERQMMRVLKEYTGFGFREYIQNIKLENAVALLEKSTVSMQFIAETVGYADTSHFYKVFKQKCGCTPIEYRAKKLQQ